VQGFLEGGGDINNDQDIWEKSLRSNYMWVDRKRAKFIGNKQIHSLSHSLTYMQTLNFIY